VKNTNVFPYPFQSKFLGILLLAFTFLAAGTSLSSQEQHHGITHPSVAKVISSVEWIIISEEVLCGYDIVARVALDSGVTATQSGS
jgi:hypothetical protein